MSVKSQFAKTIGILQLANHITITAHIRPDEDAIGSSLSLAMALQYMGKTVQIVMADKVPSKCMFLKGADAIITPSLAERKTDLLVMLDGDLKRSGIVLEMFVGTRTLNIDHHASNDGMADCTLLNTECVATAQIIYYLLEKMNFQITPAIAECLYVGIVSDTGFFRYPHTTAAALEVAARLVALGANPPVIARKIEGKKLVEWQQLLEVMSTVELVGCGKVGVIYLDDNKLNIVDTDWVMEKLSMATDIAIAVLLQQETHDRHRLRIRTNEIDASKIAALFGGGGRITAAGATLYGEYYAVKETLKEKLNELAKGDFCV